MNIIKCPNCGGKNKNTNIGCEFYGMELNHMSRMNDNFLNKDYSRENEKTANRVIYYNCNEFYILNAM